MPDASLCFTTVTVQRLYGVDHDIALEGLCEGVNVIYGPNASGKTTIARTLRALLWPEDTECLRPLVEATFAHGGEAWHAALDGSRRRYQRDGQDAGRPPLPPKIQQDRYHLYLHDLLASTDGSECFAEAIMQETAGGFDVEAAKRALGFGVTQRRTQQDTKAVRRARSALDRAKEERRRLEHQQNELANLRAKKTAAREAGERADALAQAIEVVRARRKLEAARDAVAAFPESMADVRGDEARCLRELKEQVENAERELAACKQERDQAHAVLHQSRLPDEGLPDGVLEKIREATSDLSSHEQTAREAKNKLAGARAEAEEAWTQLEFGADKDSLAALDLSTLNGLGKASRRVEDLRSRLAARKQLNEVVGDTADTDDMGDVDVLRKGLDALHHWLRSGVGPAVDAWGWKWGALVAGIVQAGLGLVLLLQTDGLASGIGAAVLLIGLLVIGIGATLDRAFPSEGADEQRLRRKDYEQLDLARPKAWHAGAVQRRADALLAALCKAELEAEKEAAWTRWKREWDVVEEELAEQKEAHRRRAEKIGLDPNWIDGHGLYWLVDRLARWQRAHGEVSRREAELREAKEIVSKRLATINGLLKPYDLHGVADAAEARAARDRLAGAGTAFREASQRAGNARQGIDRAESEIEGARGKRSRLFERLGVQDGDNEEVEALCEEHEAYQEAVREATDREVQCATQRKALQRKAGYTEAMLEASERDLNEQHHTAKEQADEAGEIADRISRIEERVDRAREGNEIEEKKAAYQRALDALQRKRREDYEKAVGAVLADLVQEETRDRDLPDVFRRAKTLFARITGGRYALRLDRESVVFRVVDTNDGRGLALDALSSGTRVQLLLAVRVAFVETKERGCKLPLVLDEALANSDDVKARAIIEALHAICADGRQVFYLTAQRDEVAKWQQALTQADLSFQVKTLADRPLRRRPDGTGAAIPARPPIPEVEDVDSLSHAAYGEIIGVPAWTPRQPMGALHLWYLIEEVRALHDLLTAGFLTWGPLKNMRSVVGQEAFGLDEAAFRRIEMLAEAVAAWREAWRIGRGKRVDRRVLEAVEPVSDRFVDHVAELAEELDGDGERLIQELRAGAVSRFRTDKMDDLEVHLTDSGYLDTRPTLTPEQMWPRVMAQVGAARKADHVSADALAVLFERFDGQAPREPPRQTAKP